jgi:hypothetical protein
MLALALVFGNRKDSMRDGTRPHRWRRLVADATAFYVRLPAPDHDSRPAVDAKTTDETLRLKLGYEWRWPEAGVVKNPPAVARVSSGKSGKAQGAESDDQQDQVVLGSMRGRWPCGRRVFARWALIGRCGHAAFQMAAA